ncbi:hypothetical protein RJ639_003134 [Escallonia herrerae]|uniref:Protein FAR1-RELATED SEQUENCE n=1 Tax=Escallonia herrerae TaxID=1293975 RepID=A0AA89AXY3_9ASTE|nr:hypothetical protein RJ639_003134 [Escallonia herrerae]
MGNALRKVFPEARHHYCSWHIKKHVMEHLQPYRARYNDFHEAHTNWVKSRTIEEFEIGWKTLWQNYEIDEKSWLANMYSMRQHWAKGKNADDSTIKLPDEVLLSSILLLTLDEAGRTSILFNGQ